MSENMGWTEWWKRLNALLDSIDYWATGAHDEMNFNRIVADIRKHIDVLPLCRRDDDALLQQWKDATK